MRACVRACVVTWSPPPTKEAADEIGTRRHIESMKRERGGGRGERERERERGAGEREREV